MRGKHCNVEIAGKLRQITPCWKSIVAHIVRCVNKDRSPRVRGKRAAAGRCKFPIRITPARAGKTGFTARSKRRTADHPRACGENLPSVQIIHSPAGSPPRVRGKHHGCGAFCPCDIITPARAGKTLGRQPAPCHRQDHPRACGENSTRGSCAAHPRGSPPRVRGKLLADNPELADRRITPARAGKTRGAGAWRERAEDHPRACGENTEGGMPMTPTEGSPPRVRGKRCTCCSITALSGITPARAGKTTLYHGQPGVSRDHPRACGENA